MQFWWVNHTLLIASHIKPWRLCKSAEERLDGANGLLREELDATLKRISAERRVYPVYAMGPFEPA
jgi:hypothetical protein